MLVDVQFDQKLIAQLFDLQPDAVVWYAPVFSQEDIVDFEYRYCNVAASRLLGVPVNEVNGTTLKSSTFLDPQTVDNIFEQCVTTFAEGKPLEFTYYSPIFRRYLNVQRSKALNGILSITRDHTHQVITEQEQKRQRSLLLTIANASPTSILLCEAMRDSAGAVIDFRLLMVNDKVSRDTGKTKQTLESMTYRQIHPDQSDQSFVDILVNVLQTGEEYKDEIYMKVFGGWSLLTVTRTEDEKLLVIALDINETKKDKIALQEQARWFNSILSHSPSGIVALESVRDHKGEIIDFEICLANKAGQTMGNLPFQPIGKRMLQIFPQMKSDGMFDHHKRVVETGVPYHDEWSFATGGPHRWFQISLVKLHDGLISNFMDITEIKRYEDTIREQARELKSILDASINGVFACEAVRNEKGSIVDFRFMKINAAFMTILNLQEKDVIGRSYLEVFRHASETGLDKIYTEVIETGRPWQGEIYYKDDLIDGWYILSVSKWGADGFVQTFNDFTKTKHLQQQLERTILGLKRSNERLTEFSHVASHDLNEPLRKIITFSKLLTDRFGPKLEAGAQDYLDRIEKTAQRMQILLENLLIYSRVSKHINTFEPVSLNTVVQEVLSDLETIISQKNARVTTEQLPVITGEKAQLRQLFQNLISNALKFQLPGNQPVISIRHRDAGPLPGADTHGKLYHLIEVADNGIGFEAEESERIFQLFHRLHSRHEFEGTGIGLAIVLRAMENHHGFADAVSEVGKGSTFRLYFPK